MVGAKLGWGRICGLVLVVLGVAGFIWGSRASRMSPDPVRYAGKTVAIATDAKAMYWALVGETRAVKGGQQLAEVDCQGLAGGRCFVLPEATGAIAIGPQTDGTAAVIYNVVPPGNLLLAAVAALALCIGLPMSLYTGGVNAWVRILSERGGGLSLSRVQLALWFTVAFVSYMATAISSGAYAQGVPAQIWQLLLLAGATSTISAGASKPMAFDWTKLKAEAQSVVSQLNALAGKTRSLPPQVQSDLEAGRTALENAAPGQWAKLQPLVAKAFQSLRDLLGSRDIQAPPYQVPTASDPAPTPAEAVAMAKQLEDMRASYEQTPVRSQPTVALVAAANNYFGQPDLGPQDLHGFLAATENAVDGLVADLSVDSKPLPPDVLASIDKLRTEIGLLGASDPGLSDLVENWNGEGDFSRVQYLVLTVGAVAIFLLQFLRTASFPDVPQEFIYVLGASQATYVGVKWVQKLSPQPGNTNQ